MVIRYSQMWFSIISWLLSKDQNTGIKKGQKMFPEVFEADFQQKITHQVIFQKLSQRKSLLGKYW